MNPSPHGAAADAGTLSRPGSPFALFIAFTHRANLQRLRQGTESRFERARLLHRLRRGPSR